MDLWRELPFADARLATTDGPFSTTPLLFMQEWLAVRRKGQDFSQSMVGELIRGRRVVRGEEVEVEMEDDASLEGDVVEGDGDGVE